MITAWLLLLFVITSSYCNDNLELLTKIRTLYLEHYESYANVIVMNFEIPQETAFASFRFSAEENKLSLFACLARNISIYLKHKSLPVINPDGVKFPDDFKNISRPNAFNLELKSDTKANYINITAPTAGFYYVATFLSYVNPKYARIKQEGLFAQCIATVEGSLFVRKSPDPELIVQGEQIVTVISEGSAQLFKFFVPPAMDHAILQIETNAGGDDDDGGNVTIRIQAESIPMENSTIKSKIIHSNGNIQFDIIENKWYYIEFSVKNRKASANFIVNFFTSNQITNETKLYSSKLTELIPYKEGTLCRHATTDTFTFTFDIPVEPDTVAPIALNVTNQEMISLKFRLRERIDVGGSLMFILAFKPRIVANPDGGKRFENEPENHTVVACISNDNREMPTWPDSCSLNSTKKMAPILLNKTVDNASVLIPYPESGVWYATFKLFCGQCMPCNCPDKCQRKFENCTMDCEVHCKNDCNNCTRHCQDIVYKDGCDECDCEGPCRRNGETCNSSLIFDLTSYQCVPNDCGRNGRCVLLVSDGLVYSACICYNGYRGWDCSDDTFVNPYWLVVLELLLLVLSNLMFLPTVYVAYKRKYYVEALVYFSVCFFSTFYHACDAGNNIINFCIAPLMVLQFGDFFCALLSIWVTIIAIANIPHLYNVLHMLGAIILAVSTTINRTSLWVFILPTVSGVAIICASWFFKYRKIHQRFLKKSYFCYHMPLGLVIVTAGLIIYTLLQTANNYKYLHSLWHVIMAISVIILLPQSDTFQTGTML